MGFSVKTGGVWKPVVTPSVKTGGVWKPAVSIWTKVGGIWKKAWEAVTASIMSISGSPASGSYVTIGALTDVTADGGPIDFSVFATVQITSAGSAGTYPVTCKLQRKTGTSSYIDVGATWSATARERLVDAESGTYELLDGNLNNTLSDTPAAGLQQYRIQAFRSSGTRTGNISGTCTITP